MQTRGELTEVKRFQQDLEKCMKCGFCTFWCPVYKEEKIESSVARGKNMLIRQLLDGEMHYNDEVANKLDTCLLCMTCTANCPAKANIPNVIIAARADKVKAKGIKFPYNFIYHRVLPHRTLFGNIVRAGAWMQKILFPKTQGTVRHLPMFLSALGKGRHIPEIAPKFLRQMVPVVSTPPTGVKKTMTIGYFTGCMTDFVFPDVGKKIISLLNRNGVEVIVPQEQGCCGAPVFLGSGDFEIGRKLADVNAEAFKDVDYVISDCATCTSAIKDYKKYLADTPERAERYEKLALKMKDISEFLVDILQLPEDAYRTAPEVKGKKVTWHDPCHLNRHLGIKEQPRKILKSLRDIEYVEMPNADVCCGMGGTFSINYYDLSGKIAKKKVDGITGTGADIVVTGCPGCEIQLIDNLIKHNKNVRVMHIMELLE
jgi:glycolate oxidase iron-sulfur subunit